MPERVAAALLIAVAITYIAGAVLLVAALAKVLLSWSTGQRTRRAAAPVDVALQQRAATAMASVAQLANVPAPATDVLAILGAPTGAPEREVGDEGLAVTRFRAGRPTVVFAQVALTGLSPAAVQSLAAHELAHVLRRAHSSTTAHYAWLLGYLVFVLAGLSLTITALVAAPQLAGPGDAGHHGCRRRVPRPPSRLRPARGDRRRPVRRRPDPRPRRGQRADAVLREQPGATPARPRSRPRVGAPGAALVRHAS